MEDGRQPQSVAAPEVVQTPTTGFANADLQDLEAIQQGVERFIFISQAGSVLEKPIGLVVSAIDALKSVAWGAAWKTIVKVAPPIVIVDNTLANIKATLQHVTTPLATLRQILPSVIQSLRAQQAGHVRPAEVCGQLYAVASIIPAVHSDLNHLSSLIETTCGAIGSLGNAVKRIESIKGVGPMACQLGDALSKLKDSLDLTQASAQELAAAIDRTMNWLPDYQVQSRKQVTDSRTCQMIVASGLFKKELCQQPVAWFDDEAPPTCNRCGINVCEQHRVPVSMPAGSLVRHTWLCLSCTRKQRK